MSANGAYGQRLGNCFQMKETPTIVARALRQAEIAVTELRSDDPPNFLTGSIPWEDAFLIGLQVRAFPDHQYWEGGRPARKNHLQAGESVLFDLKRDPVALIDKPYHSIHFYIPRAALNFLADEADAPRIDDLAYKPGKGVADPIIRDLGLSMLGAFSRPEQVSRIFVDHVTLAVAAHVAHTYGGLQSRLNGAQGGLAPRQLRHVQELLSTNLDGSLPLKNMAEECSLSVRHFSRAFRKSTGLAPHQWLMQRRLELAKAQLRETVLTLSEVALACGFADQSHFTRVFTRAVGISPGAWRRDVT